MIDYKKKYEEARTLLVKIESNCQKCPDCHAYLRVDREKSVCFIEHEEDCLLNSFLSEREK